MVYQESSNFEKVGLVGVELFNAVRRTGERRTVEKTDTTKLTVAFRFIGKAPKKWRHHFTPETIKLSAHKLD
jgi:hypothetical protein